MTLRFAIMGTGRIAGKVAPSIAEAAGCDVTVAASRSSERANAFASELGIPGACTYDELAGRDDVDAVYITLPNSDHPTWSERLLTAGKHVLCEKPLCWTKDQAERLFEIAADHDRLLVEAFMYLHSPLTDEAVRIARAAMTEPDDSPIGRLERIEASFDVSIADGHTGEPVDNIRYSRALAGGSLMDLGCYPLSFARHITGKMPKKLEAEVEMVDLYAPEPGAKKKKNDAVDGRVRLTGTIASGVALNLTCSMIEDPAAGPNVVARLIGDRGEAVVRDFPRPERIEITSGGATEVIESPIENTADVYRLQAESFAMAAAGAGKPLPSPSWSIKQAKAIEKSLKQIGLKFDKPAPAS